MGHVVYDLEKQTQLVEIFFSLIKQSEEKDAALIASDSTKQVSPDYLVSHLLRLLALYKHPTFSDEREVRLLYTEPLKIMDEFSQEIAERQYRVSGGLIVPFTDTGNTTKVFSSDTQSDTPKRLPLKSVTIGPTAHADVLARGMGDLLANLGYHNVEVSLSETPLRS